MSAIDGSGEMIDEAMQRLRTSLIVGDSGQPRLMQYAGRGPLRAWVGIAAARTALMMRRSQKRAREVVGDDDWTSSLAMISTNNPELELLKRQYAAAFAVALRDAVGELEARLRSVLKMSYVDGLSIDEIGTIYAVHRATAARWYNRARAALIVHRVGPGFDDHFFSVDGVGLDRELVPHGARSHEERGLFAEQPGGIFLKSVDSRVFPENIIPQLGGEHGFPHSGRRPGDRVTSQINHLFHLVLLCCYL